MGQVLVLMHSPTFPSISFWWKKNLQPSRSPPSDLRCLCKSGQVTYARGSVSSFSSMTMILLPPKDLVSLNQHICKGLARSRSSPHTASPLQTLLCPFYTGTPRPPAGSLIFIINEARSGHLSAGCLLVHKTNLHTFSESIFLFSGIMLPQAVTL